jgi:Peptidase family C25
MKALISIFLGFLLLISTTSLPGSGQEIMSQSWLGLYSQGSSRMTNVDAIVVSDADPYFSLISTSVACWYDNETNTSGLLPLLIHHGGSLTDAQVRFLDSVFNSTDFSLLVLGHHLQTSFPSTEILGSAPSVACSVATSLFSVAPTVLILPYDSSDAYQLSLLAAPLASYLNMPLLIFDDNEAEIQSVCSQLQTTHAYLVGDVSLDLGNITITSLPTESVITDMMLAVIKDRFGSINYLTMTNPSDVVSPSVIDTTAQVFSDRFINRKLIILGKEFDIVGNDTRLYTFFVPDGLVRLQLSAEIIPKHGAFIGRFSPIVPLLFYTLTDAQGQVVSYGNSMGYDIGKTIGETLSCHASGSYGLQITVYQGIKGGFFIQRGLSYIDANVTVNVTVSSLSSPHLPLIPSLSSLAPYLTAAHGGLILANASWELTDESYETVAQGSGSGPWYTESLHPFTNAKVNRTVEQLMNTLESLESHDLLTGYLSGPAWLALLADPTMIPMYYYGPSQEDIPDRGLPSDNPYSLNQSLSVGRLIGWDVQDVSVLLARTFFYETLCGAAEGPDEWHSSFHFVFGEGYSETGGVFHQIPYAKKIRDYGFTSKVYGDFRNSRQIAELLDVYTGANYLEYLGHGDWFWFPASLYGLDMYSKAVDVAHAKDWVFEKPSIFLSAACLMGRTDGLPPQMNIGLALLHAGCNGFVGATRETGQESGLTVLENHLIVDDWSLGEALRGEKQIDKELPTFYVRVLYGDPAFNPYEPLHGFSNQGRPVLLVQ